jgi:hypothetical protein
VGHDWVTRCGGVGHRRISPTTTRSTSEMWLYALEWGRAGSDPWRHSGNQRRRPLAKISTRSIVCWRAPHGPGGLGHIGGGQLQHLSALRAMNFRYPRPSTIRISRVTPPSSAASASL